MESKSPNGLDTNIQQKNSEFNKYISILKNKILNFQNIYFSYNDFLEAEERVEEKIGNSAAEQSINNKNSDDLELVSFNNFEKKNYYRI